MLRNILLAMLILPVAAFAADTVSGYNKKNGKHVSSYHRTAPNHTKRDNYSHKGNYDPYTGKVGHKADTRP